MHKNRKAVAVLLACLTIVSQVTTAVASTMKDLKTRQTQLTTQTQKAKDLLDDIKTEKSDLTQQLLALDAELDIVSDEYNAVNADLESTTALLAQTETELADAVLQQEAQYEAFREHVRYMYENGNIGYLEALMNAASFSDFINRMEYVNRIVEYDQNLLQRLADTENTIAQKVDEISIQQAEIAVLAAQLEVQKVALEESISTKDILIRKLAEDEKVAEQQIKSFADANAAVAASIKKIEAEQAAAARAAASSTKASTTAISYDGKMKWPVPSSTRVSSGYGPRQSPVGRGWEFHTGIDIPASSGAQIVAADGGTVISAGWMNGYGYTVVLNHGGGVTTLYGHASKLLVSKGQTVSKGQAIALIGSTGWSTGPHLHFQVMENGAHVTPKNYLNY